VLVDESNGCSLGSSQAKGGQFQQEERVVDETNRDKPRQDKVSETFDDDEDDRVVLREQKTTNEIWIPVSLI
jgi:hypothetical protein